jgi:hypothetical protein
MKVALFFISVLQQPAGSVRRHEEAEERATAGDRQERPVAQ